MNNSLDRLFEGIIGTLRQDVIPHVGDSYARGQAVAVIDLLNSISHRIEWVREPILESVRAKRALLDEVAAQMGDGTASHSPAEIERLSTADLIAERARLDAAICDALHEARLRQDEAAGVALSMLLEHVHDELEREKQMTRKPLFAEIASGKGKTAE